MSEIQSYKALKPESGERFAELNNNAFRMIISAKYVGDVDDKAFEKENIISGRFVEKQVESFQRAGTARDLSEEYKRLKYSDKAIKELESQMDERAFEIRERISSGDTTKKAGIDACWLEKKYTHKQIMFITMSYYSTVYERRIVLENEKKI